MAGSLYGAQPNVARGQQQGAQSFLIPAPVRGMNAKGSVAEMGLDECIYTYNIMPTEYGLRTRLGSREWAKNVVGVGVRTLIPFDGVASGQVNDKLFAVSNDGIYDVTVDGTTAPVKVLDFPNKTDESGYGHFTHYTNDNGDSVMVAAFSGDGNGLYEYDPNVDLWQRIAGISGPPSFDETKIAFVMSHKQRLWLIQDETDDAYYLPVGSKTGNVTLFDFGNKFKYGGELAGLYNWTIDGGSGVDDYLVAISGGGDVIVYQGEDPATVQTWNQVGTWYVGEVPGGRRIATEYGGSLQVLSSMGIISLQELVQGIWPVDSEASAVSATAKISRLIRNRMALALGSKEWEIRMFPGEAVLIVNTPISTGESHEQFVMNMPTQGWGIWRDLPMLCSENYSGKFYFGTTEGSVWLLDGGVDDVTITAPNPQAINFSLLTSYQTFGSPAEYKQMQFLRPSWLAPGDPSYTVKPLYDYDLEEILNTGNNPGGGAGEWDTGTWDLAIWGGGLTPWESLQGGGGYGRNIAVALRGQCTVRTTLVGVDVSWTKGWFL